MLSFYIEIASLFPGLSHHLLHNVGIILFKLNNVAMNEATFFLWIGNFWIFVLLRILVSNLLQQKKKTISLNSTSMYAKYNLSLFCLFTSRQPKLTIPRLSSHQKVHYSRHCIIILCSEHKKAFGRNENVITIISSYIFNCILIFFLVVFSSNSPSF